MILPADHVLRAVIDARLPVPLLLLVCFWSYLFHAVMLSHQVGDVPLTCVAAVDYASGIHVASSNYWIPFTKIFMAVLRYFRIHISQLSPFGAARESHFEVLTRVLDLAPSVTVFQMGLLDFIKTADPRKVQAVEIQKKDNQVKLLESTSHCLMSLVTPAAGGSSSAAAPEVSAPAEVEPENLRKDHPSLATDTGGKTLAGLRQLMLISPLVLRPSFQADIHAHVVVQSARTAYVPVYTAAATVTSTRENVGITPTSDVAGSSQLETSEGSDDSFYELPTLNSAEAKRWYVPRWNITNDSLFDDVQRGGARQICLESKVRSRVEHELELKEKLKGKYDARGRLLEEKDLEILRLKSLLVEEAEKAETAKVVRLRDQVSALTAEVSALKSTIAQKDTDISLLDSHATYLKSALDDSQVACAETGSLITSLTSERDRLTSEVLYNRVAELEAHVMDVSGHLEGEFYPAYLTTLAGRSWFLTHGIQLVVLKCLKSPEYQGILGHALGRTMDFGMQEGLEAGYEHGVAGTQLSAVEAYNPEAARTSYFDAVRALEDVDFPLVSLLKSKKDAEMDEVLDCFILDGPLADLPEAAHLQPYLEQLSVPIHHSDDKAIVGETSLSFALLNVHSRAEGAKKHVAALRQLMMEIVSNPLSSQTWVGETSTSAAPLSVEDFDEEDTDEALGSVVAIPKFEACRF
ncbi:hypothetical protein Tco_0461709 [Tanacetum coccineum]